MSDTEPEIENAAVVTPPGMRACTDKIITEAIARARELRTTVSDLEKDLDAPYSAKRRAQSTVSDLEKDLDAHFAKRRTQEFHLVTNPHIYKSREAHLAIRRREDEKTRARSLAKGKLTIVSMKLFNLSDDE